MPFLVLYLLLIPFLLFGKEIALTFDDIPMPKGALFDREERVDRFLKVLTKNNLQAAFFCIGQYVENEEGKKCVEKLSEASQFLANHSYRHAGLSTLSLEEFQEETLRTQKLISPYPMHRNWYRFPYLDFGNREEKGGSDLKKREAFIVLQNKGLIHGYITINTFDWYLEKCLQDAIKSGKHIEFDRLKEVYLSLMDEWIVDYEILWNKVMGREIAHILLLHGNDLNAYFLQDLIAFLREKGWTIVSPEKAYRDTPLHYTTLGDLSIQRLGTAYITPASLSTAHIDSALSKAKVFEK